MDKTALVSLDIERGREILDALERAKLKMAIALWVYSSEYEDWRLVLSARQFDSPDPRDAYRRLNETLAADGLTPERTPPVLILPMSDSFTRELRELFAKTKNVEGMRLGGQMIGDRFVEDAYVYRI